MKEGYKAGERKLHERGGDFQGSLTRSEVGNCLGLDSRGGTRSSFEATYSGRETRGGRESGPATSKPFMRKAGLSLKHRRDHRLAKRRQLSDLRVQGGGKRKLGPRPYDELD